MRKRIKLFSDKIIRKKIKPGEKIFIDMDNCLVNFASGIDKLSKKVRDSYAWEDLDDVPGIFSKMEPNEGAVEVITKLAQKYDLYILSTAPWKILLPGLINYYGFRNILEKKKIQYSIKKLY